ncbi:hypothetical protein KFL_001320150 [Klebsormidium nitens]|uniref:Nucleolar protein 12 n=1 Tax=Klebsormidium nitens TaxID=105231 RepID=A0A1Y1I2M9_KLENI|nr:hypothetical protein KFL_001320150 [Klebsormidium nitens]|eukprot:GAQ83007.1 hypothetical protein KFL_001320150 [Klebsormidium nitens]
MDDAPGSDDERAMRHVNKRARKAKGVVAVFDENARREFVTGFRKRKQQRRKQAEKENIEKERKKRIQIRKERRLAEQANIAEAGKGAQLMSADDVAGKESDAGEPPEEDDAKERLEDVVVYDDAAAVTTVIIKGLGDEDSDEERGNSGDDELLAYGKERLKERNKKLAKPGSSLKQHIKKRLAHKANNKKGHNKKSKNSNSRQKSKKKGS